MIKLKMDQILCGIFYQIFIFVLIIFFYKIMVDTLIVTIGKKSVPRIYQLLLKFKEEIDPK